MSFRTHAIILLSALCITTLLIVWARTVEQVPQPIEHQKHAESLPLHIPGLRKATASGSSGCSDWVVMDPGQYFDRESCAVKWYRYKICGAGECTYANEFEETNNCIIAPEHGWNSFFRFCGSYSIEEL